MNGWTTTYGGRVEPSECDYWGDQNVQKCAREAMTGMRMET